VTIACSIALFLLAALAEIGVRGWSGRAGVNIRACCGWAAAGSSPAAPTGSLPRFSLIRISVCRILAAYGGIFVAGSLAWGMVVDKFQPDRYDAIGRRPACSAWP